MTQENEDFCGECRACIRVALDEHCDTLSVRFKLALMVRDNARERRFHVLAVMFHASEAVRLVDQLDQARVETCERKAPRVMQ